MIGRVIKHPVQLDCMVELIMMLMSGKGKLAVCVIRQWWSAKKKNPRYLIKSRITCEIERKGVKMRTFGSFFAKELMKVTFFFILSTYFPTGCF